MLAPIINIVTVVDVIRALATRSLKDSLYMMDTSRHSDGQGTPRLTTACHPGQRIHWIIRAIDVQTPASIRDITFPRALGDGAPAHGFGPEPAAGETLAWRYWSGIVPAYLPCGVYRYRLTVQMGTGRRSVLHADTPALKVMLPQGAP